MARLRVPHTLVLLVGMIAVAFLLSYVLPQGSFERVENEQGREQVVPGSFQRAPEPTRLSPIFIFNAIPEGFAGAQEIIFFVFLIGGAISVMRATGAIDAFLGLVLDKFGKRPGLLIAGTMLVFCIGSSTIGMAEEYLPFVPILLALAIGLGFDAVTAIGILCVGYGIGYGIAPINPFTVLIAQDVAGVQPTSGWGYRMAIAVPFLAVGIHHVWSYASRVKRDPSTSLVADVDIEHSSPVGARQKLTGRQVVVLLLFAAAIPLTVYGLSAQLSDWHWYVEEMGALFVGLAVLFAIVSGMGFDRAAKEFCKGAAELTTTALLIGFARTILVVLERGNIIDTIVNAIAQPLAKAGPSLAAVGMFFVQSLCNLFIPSGSGQAYVTMPIMAPLADLVGVSRQVAVLAYQFGDGFTNIIVPTNAVLVGILAMAGIPFDRWLRFILPFMVKIWIVGSLLLAVAVWIGYS